MVDLSSRAAADDEPPPRLAPGPREALQDVLAAEHAATYLLAFLGARVPDSAPELAERLRAVFEAHRAARDDLAALLIERGVDPVAALPDYAVPAPARTPQQLETAARDVEERVVAVYAHAVGGTAGEDRRRVLQGLQAAAVRSLTLGATPSALPGLG